MSILEEIFAHKRTEVADQRQTLPLSEVQALAKDTRQPKNFIASLFGAPSRPALIAEVKFASPSRGTLVDDVDPISLADKYWTNGAAAVSVLTDEHYFGGHLDHLRQIANQIPDLPLLRKDFILDPYQVYQSRAAGAAAVLLIVSALTSERLQELQLLAQELGMAALVEVHSAEELEVALSLSPELVGINNRDLADFSVDLGTTRELMPQIASEICTVSESGIHTPEDAASLGVDAILVGEAIVSAPEVAAKVRELAGFTATELS